MDLAAALGAVGAALNVAKSIKDIDAAFDRAAYKIQIADLMSNLADVKVAVLEAQEELRDAKAENERLTNALSAKGDLIEGPGGHLWISQEGLKLGYPVCPSCLEREGRQVILKQDGGMASTRCPRCASAFQPVEYFHKPDAAGVQKSETEVAREKRQAANEARRRQINRYGSMLG